MHRSASKRLNKKCSSQDASEGRVKDDNFNKIRNVFEIPRPNKSPNSILTESKSTPSFSRALSCFEEKIKSNKDTTFLRNSSSRSSIRSISKHKKGRPNITETKPKGIEKMLTPVEFSNTMKQDSDRILKVQDKLNEIFANGNKHYKEQEARRGSEEKILEKTFDKNDKLIKTKTQFYTKESFMSSPDNKEIIAKRTKDIKSFIEAECEGETETYRRSLVLEMDLELAKMKLDGFIDDDEHIDSDITLDINPEIENVHNYRKARYKQLFEGISHEFEMFQNEYESRMNTEGENYRQKFNFSDEDLTDCQKCVENLAIAEDASNQDVPDLGTHGTASHNDIACGISNDSVSLHNFTIQKQETNLDDEFSESLGDDLENGSFFVEAYNDEGRELVIVEISIERRTVNLDKPYSLESIQNSFKNADMVFQEKNDKTLNVINDPKELIHENSELVSYGPDSNRSTLYSITSRDSDLFDTDDEGISMGNVELRNCADEAVYNNARRETFCDHKGIVRIERIGYPEAVNSPTFDDGMEQRSPVSRNNSFTQKGQLSYIIDEIKSTEKKYVEDLRKVVNRYMPYIEEHTPSNLIGTSCYIFGNLPKLFEYQKQFLGALEICGDEIEDVVKTFINFEHLFELYPNYFKNKPKADAVLREFSHVVKKAQERFKERLDLSAYLLTPLQRLGKYKLFLESIEKQLGKLELPTGSATMALEIIKREMSKGNDFVAIESIENSPISKLDYGSFKMREKFNILKPRRLESMVFLFDNIVVFTLYNQNNMEKYLYWDSIKMNDLRIATFEDLTMHLTDFTKCKRTSRADKYTYVLEAKTEKIRATWRKAIEDMLWQQLLNVKENTLKMYQRPQKERTQQRRNRTKSTGASTFYVTI